MEPSVSMRVAAGSPCTDFHCASVTGVWNSDGSMTIRCPHHQVNHQPLRTHSVGATCQAQFTKQFGLLRVGVCSDPKIHIFLGYMPMLFMSRRISCARPQQPSSGYMNGMHGGAIATGLHVVALIASKICCARVREMQR